MQSTTLAQPTEKQTATLPEPQVTALIKLLGDEDPMVYQAVKQKLISLGSDTQIWLKPCQLSGDATLRKHAKDIVQHFDRETADSRFMAYCLQDDSMLDLEKGALLFAQTQHPEINPVAYSALLDEMAGELREWLATSDPKERLLARGRREAGSRIRRVVRLG